MLRLQPADADAWGINALGDGSTPPKAATRPLPSNRSSPENLLAFQLKAARITFERQFHIHPSRRFRADFYLPKQQLVVEVDGGGYVNGRHSRGKGMERDCEKSAYIAHMPARLIRVTPGQVKDGRALQWIEAA